MEYGTSGHHIHWDCYEKDVTDLTQSSIPIYNGAKPIKVEKGTFCQTSKPYVYLYMYGYGVGVKTTSSTF